MGRVLSKVCMTPPKAFLRASAVVAISGLPSRLAFGTRQFSSTIWAVSEARMPSLCSTRVTVMPGVPLGTRKDLIAALPRVRSSDAHTTTCLLR